MIRRNIFFIILLGIILGILLWYNYLRTHKDKHSFVGYDIEGADFFGISSQTRPYNVKVDYIKKIDKKIYNLNRVYAKYYLDTGKEKYAEVMSPAGGFNELKNVLDLNGGVEFILSHGYRMLTNNFSIDMNKNVATTKDEVSISGAQGKVVSKTGMIVYMKDKKALFHGPIQSMFIEKEVAKG
jgi:hypothetical protein